MVSSQKSVGKYEGHLAALSEEGDELVERNALRRVDNTGHGYRPMHRHCLAGNRLLCKKFLQR
jgi:hypothetical protein